MNKTLLPLQHDAINGGHADAEMCTSLLENISLWWTDLGPEWSAWVWLNSNWKCPETTVPRYFTWYQPSLFPPSPPVAPCLWHNSGNQKPREMLCKNCTWGGTFSNGSESGRFLPFLGTLAPMQAQPKPQLLLKFHSAFSSLFFKARQRIWEAETNQS